MSETMKHCAECAWSVWGIQTGLGSGQLACAEGVKVKIVQANDSCDEFDCQADNQKETSNES